MNPLAAQFLCLFSMQLKVNSAYLLERLQALIIFFERLKPLFAHK